MMTLCALRLPATLCAQFHHPFSSLAFPASALPASASPPSSSATSAPPIGAGHDSGRLSTTSTSSPDQAAATNKPTTLIGAGIWARITALATQTSTLPQPVAVELGPGHHVRTLAELGLRVLQKAESPDTAKHQSVADLVLAASIPRRDLARHLREAYDLLQPNGHLVAAWNERDLCHPLSKAMTRLRSSPLSSPTPPHMPPSLLNASPAAAAATAKATASSSAHCSHMSSSSAGSVAGMRGRGVSTHACAHADGCAAQLAGVRQSAGGAEEEEGPLEYNDMRMLMESVVGEHGRSLFRVVAFSILPCAPAGADACKGVPGGPLTLPFETKMFVLRKAS